MRPQLYFLDMSRGRRITFIPILLSAEITTNPRMLIALLSGLRLDALRRF